MKAVKMCVTKTLPLHLVPLATKHAIEENVDNAPDSSTVIDALVHGLKPPEGEKVEHPEGMGMPLEAMLYTKKRFAPGRELKVGFFPEPELTPTLRKRIHQKGEELEDLFNLRYKWVGTQTDIADVRISVTYDAGSWSYLGPDIFAIPKDQPTLNMGWIREDTDDRELNRVFKHEFLHNAGLGHEHQNPKGGLKWNVPAVLAYYMGPPNNWSEADVYQQVITPASVDQIIATRRDPKSIMHYAIDARFLLDPSQATTWNTTLSDRDKAFLKDVYPYTSQEEAA